MQNIDDLQSFATIEGTDYSVYNVKADERLMMEATKAQLAVDIDFEKAKYPLMSMPKYDGCRAINLDGTLKARSLKPP